MIIIEVKFGIINGNPISVDSSLSTTSTNPVENRIITQKINALQSALNDVQDDLGEKEVVTYGTEALLQAYITNLLANGTTAELQAAAEKLYYAEDTNKLYKFDGTELHEVTTDDAVIIKGTQTQRDTALAAYVTDTTKKVIWVNTANNTSSVYNLSVETKTTTVDNVITTTITQVLSNRDGYAQRTKNGSAAWTTWTDKKYSYQGHTHAASDITGLTDAVNTIVEAATTGKQDKTDDNLDTTNKTVVGAINEVKGIAEATFHSFTIDFQDEREIVQQRAVGGAFTMTKISADNVSTLTLHINGTQNTITLTNGVWTGSIAVPADALLVWQIGRTTEGQIAEINIKFNY